MKKIFLSLVIALWHFTVYSQTINVHLKNGQTIEYPASNVDYVDFSGEPSNPDLSEGEIIDLGLSVYWASCNLGAEKPEEYGNYYAWGETKPKDEYTKENYSYYDANTLTYINIGDGISGTEYDAATVNLGDGWKMPSRSDYAELFSNCKFEWTQVSGIKGYKLTGPNGNSIFFPSAGYASGSSPKEQNESMVYITSSLGWDDHLCYAHVKYNSEDPKNFFSGMTCPRYWGGSIRPVKRKENATTRQ